MDLNLIATFIRVVEKGSFAAEDARDRRETGAKPGGETQ